MILRIIIDIVQLYLIIIFIRVVLSWIPIDPWSRWSRAVTLVDRVTDPVLVPIRRMLPPFRIGGGALDLSPLIVVVGLEIVLSVLRRA
jgi:YggT family protein